MGGRFRIGVSLVVGFAIIASAYFLRGSATASTALEDPRALVAAVPQREYQDTKDSDGDGIRDWLEELIGTNPLVNDASSTPTLQKKASTTPFVANTETKKFAISFFEDVLKTHGGKSLSDEEKKAILDSSTGKFVSLSTSTLFTRSDITILAEGDSENIRSYGNIVGASILAGGANTKKVEPELVILARALSSDDAKDLADLAIIKAGYANIIEHTLATPVPEPLINDHLLLLNSLEAVRADIEGFQKTFSDPLVSYVRFKRYLSDVKGLTTAIEGIRIILEREHTVYSKDEAGGFFFTLRP